MLEAAVVAAVVEPQVTAGEVSFITRPPPNQWEVLQSRLEFQACFLHPISRKIKNLIFRRQGVCDPNVQNASLIFRGSCVMNNVCADQFRWHIFASQCKGKCGNVWEIKH